jgi:Flp pilus assembly pilin Flp
MFLRGTALATNFRQMRDFLAAARAFLRDDSGQDLAEYGLLCSLIAVVVLAAVGDVGVQISDLWANIVDQIEAFL